MSKLRVHCFSMSLDGFGAGPDQSLSNPLGVGGPELHTWQMKTLTFRRRIFGTEQGETGINDEFVARGFRDVGAWILGRNMFGPIRGPWPDESWKGWWGDIPPYRSDVFVLTHHTRAPVKMEGGTTFHFVTDGIEEGLRLATAAAKGKDVRLGGGAATIRQFLQARLIDELHLAVVPVVLGRGEHLLRDVDLKTLGYTSGEFAATPNAAHVVLTRQDAG